jgi:hypothetical protein
VEPAADIYSFGVLLYQLVTGHTPFEGASLYELILKVTTQPAVPPREFRPDLPEPANAALLRALAKQPAQRFANASGLAQAFTKGLQGQWTENLQSNAAFGAGDRTEADGSVVPSPTSWPFSPKQRWSPKLRRKGGANKSVALILSTLTAVSMVVLIVGYLLLPALGATDWLTQLSSLVPVLSTATAVPSPTMRPTPTDTPAPTPVLSYSAAIPGPGCGSSGWVAADQPQGTVQCAATGLLMASPSGASANTSVFWNGAGLTPTTYSVRVTVSKLTSACGGIGFQNGYRAYIGYICANGRWVVVRYDSSGSPTQLQTGFVAQQSAQLIEIIVTGGSTVQFHIGAATLFTDSIANGYDTEAVTLALYAYAGQSGQGFFSDFVYGRT